MYNMVNSGQSAENFEKYSHDNSIMIEATGDIRKQGYKQYLPVLFCHENNIVL